MRTLNFLLLAWLGLLSGKVFAVDTVIHRDDWYLSQPDEYVTVQLSGHANEEDAIAYIESSGLSADTGYYQTLYKDQPWYAVTSGVFSTLAEARGQLKTLPAHLQRNAPWPRTFKTIKSLINLAENLPGDHQQKEGTVKHTAPPSSTWEEGQAAYDEGDLNKAFKIWHALAKQGDELSQFNLGVMYSRGEGGEKSASKAIEWYTRSAEQGYAPAQFNLGAAYLDDGSTVVDKKKAATWWKMAAEQGFVQAQFNLASLYCRGIGVSRDMEQCKFWYRRAASNGDMLARKMLDQIINSEKAKASAEDAKQAVESDDASLSATEKITGTDQNTEQPLQTETASVETAAVPATALEKLSGEKKQNIKQELKPAARKINAQEHIMLRKAQSAFTRNHYMKSHDIWLPLAESGIAEAQYSLGFLYQSGWGPERDLHKAVTWYTSAAEQNEARAQFNLGVLFLGGEDEIDEDTETAMLWLTRSAENDNARAKEFLIDVYSEGQYGIEKSNEKADYWRSR